MADRMHESFLAQKGNRWIGGELTRKREYECRGRVVSDLAKRSGIACPRCRAPMQEIMRIAPLRIEPGLIAYECPTCGKVTSEILPAGRTTDQSDAP